MELETINRRSNGVLVITRKLNEVIRIGDDIEVMVIRISPEQVRLGVTAPKEVNVVRLELIHRDDAKAKEAR